MVLLLVVLLSSLPSFGEGSCNSDWEVLERGVSYCRKVERQTGDLQFSIEERGRIRGNFGSKPMENEYKLFEAGLKLKGALGGSSSACGLNVFANYLYGLKTNIKALESFLEDWSKSAPAVALYALATYLPVAKEALLGIEMISNAVASLRGFTCERAMQMIRQMNYTDSVLIENCIKNKMCTKDGVCSDDDDAYDSLKETNPKKWFNYYNECLSKPNLFDAISPSLKQWFASHLNYRENLYCLFWGDKPYHQVISDLPDSWTSGGLTERAKILAFALLPSFEFSTGLGDEKAKIQVGGLELLNEKQDLRKLLEKMLGEELETDVMELVDKVFSGHAVCSQHGVSSAECSSALEDSAKAIRNFEKKWNVEVGKALDVINLIGEVEAILEKRRAEGDPYAVEVLRDVFVAMRSYYVPVVQKQVFLEVKRALEQKYDQLIATAIAKSKLGSSFGCKPSGDSSGSGSGGSGSGSGGSGEGGGSSGGGGPTDKDAEKVITVLMENRKTMRDMLDSTGEKLGIKNLNEYDFYKRFKDAFYEAVKKIFPVDEEGWIDLGKTQDGSSRFVKLDDNLNLFKRTVSLEANLEGIDLGELERAMGFTTPSPSGGEEEGGGGVIPLNTYRFIALLLTTASSVALLYSSATALLRKDLAQAGIRFLASLLLASLGYVLLKKIPL